MYWADYLLLVLLTSRCIAAAIKSCIKRIPTSTCRGIWWFLLLTIFFGRFYGNCDYNDIFTLIFYYFIGCYDSFIEHTSLFMAIEKYTEFNRLKFSSILFEVKSNQIEDLNENVFDGVLHTHLSIFWFVLSIFGELVSVLESNAALNPIKCIQSPMLAIWWRCCRYDETTFKVIDVLTIRWSNWINSDNDEAYSKMDKLMLLLAQPRCIAAGCSPIFWHSQICREKKMW